MYVWRCFVLNNDYNECYVTFALYLCYCFISNDEYVFVVAWVHEQHNGISAKFRQMNIEL